MLLTFDTQCVSMGTYPPLATSARSFILGTMNRSQHLLFLSVMSGGHLACVCSKHRSKHVQTLLPVPVIFHRNTQEAWATTVWSYATVTSMVCAFLRDQKHTRKVQWDSVLR